MSSNVAMMFPGQGSQTLGMLADLAEAHGAVAETFAEASDALGEDLWALAQQGPEDALNRTENTQPVLLAASVAVYGAWRAAGGAAPVVASGHSLGEYSALVAAGALGLADATRLVRLRGQAMQAAVPQGAGAMAAILGLDDAAVEACCAEAAGDGVVSAANYNAPGQVVIAGDAAAVDRAIEACKGAGAKRAMALSVSVPSHCALMEGAVEPLREALAGIELAAPEFPVIHNVDASVSADADGIRARLVDQLHAPVRWTACVAAMKDAGASTLHECGPGKVLTGMIKRIDRDLTASAIGSADALTAALGA
jgi:[acyl-carrier-protein] S-malonyltransferase